MIRLMKSKNESVLAPGLADRLATSAELSSIASRSNLMRAFVLRGTLIFVAPGFAAALLPGARAGRTASIARLSRRVIRQRAHRARL
jgi:hypothetical protein